LIALSILKYGGGKDGVGGDRGEERETSGDVGGGCKSRIW